MDIMKPFKITNRIIFKLDESVNFKEKFFIVIIFLVGLLTIVLSLLSEIAKSYTERGYTWVVMIGFVALLVYDVR